MLNELATQIYDYVAERIQDNYSPTVREICTDLGIKSTSTVHKYLNMLIEEGLLEKDSVKRFAVFRRARVGEQFSIKVRLKR